MSYLLAGEEAEVQGYCMCLLTSRVRTVALTQLHIAVSSWQV
jgi:hypothetical protein